LKLLYICECCDAVVDEADIPAQPNNGRVSGLTGVKPLDIMKLGSGQGRIYITTLCDDCRETLYGSPDSGFINGPTLH